MVFPPTVKPLLNVTSPISLDAPCTNSPSVAAAVAVPTLKPPLADCNNFVEPAEL